MDSSRCERLLGARVAWTLSFSVLRVAGLDVWSELGLSDFLK